MLMYTKVWKTLLDCVTPRRIMLREAFGFNRKVRTKQLFSWNIVFEWSQQINEYVICRCLLKNSSRMRSVQKAHQQYDEAVNLSWCKKYQIHVWIHFHEHFEDTVYVITLIFVYMLIYIKICSLYKIHWSMDENKLLCNCNITHCNV